jgi:hypothetical protein
VREEFIWQLSKLAFRDGVLAMFRIFHAQPGEPSDWNGRKVVSLNSQESLTKAQTVSLQL